MRGTVRGVTPDKEGYHQCIDLQQKRSVLTKPVSQEYKGKTHLAADLACVTDTEDGRNDAIKRNTAVNLFCSVLALAQVLLNIALSELSNRQSTGKCSFL